MKTESAYSKKLRDPRWQKKKNGILERDNYTCRFCNNKESELQVHHLAYVKGNEPWECPDDYLVTLCKECHVSVTETKHVLGLMLGSTEFRCAIKPLMEAWGLDPEVMAAMAGVLEFIIQQPGTDKTILSFLWQLRDNIACHITFKEGKENI